MDVCTLISEVSLIRGLDQCVCEVPMSRVGPSSYVVPTRDEVPTQDEVPTSHIGTTLDETQI